jgi:hypothetical protein
MNKVIDTSWVQGSGNGGYDGAVIVLQVDMTVTSKSRTGNVAKLNLTNATGCAIGQSFTSTGVNGSGFNVTATITGVVLQPDGSGCITFANTGSNVGLSASTGTVVAQSGMPSGYIYVWQIMKTDLSATDLLTSQSSSSPNMPSNWTFKRLIGRFRYENYGSWHANSVLSANPVIGGAEYIYCSRNFIVPEWGASFICEVVAGGGGGDASGCGGYSRKFLSGLTPGDTILATIGLTGTVDSGDGPGDGGGSSFGAYMSCTGGRGSTNVPGAGTGGDLNGCGPVAGYGNPIQSGLIDVRLGI